MVFKPPKDYEVSRNAVLPQFLTWKIQVGAVGEGLKFPGTCLVYCHLLFSSLIVLGCRS